MENGSIGDATERLEGGCLCGRVRYVLNSKPLDAGYCHCRLCQRANGAPTVLWLTLPITDFEFTAGDPASYQSTPFGTRQFCRDCGTPLTFTTTAAPTRIDVTIASLDDPNAVTPDYHIWAGTQLACLQMADGLPSYRDSGPDG